MGSVTFQLSAPVLGPDGKWYNRSRYLETNSDGSTRAFGERIYSGSEASQLPNPSSSNFSYMMMKEYLDIMGEAFSPQGALIELWDLLDKLYDWRTEGQMPPEWTIPYDEWPGTDTPWDPETLNPDDPLPPPPAEPSPGQWPPKVPSPPKDPLVVDLDGDGVELISLSSSQAHFDYDQDGFREKTGWVSADDAFLVHDDNGDGVVNGIAELFGSPTEDGFSALSAFDSNQDGKVDLADTNFASLKLWRDLDGDGEFDPGELFSLGDYNITSISTSGTATSEVIAGNRVALDGHFQNSNGSSGSVKAILFATDYTASEWVPPPNFVPEPDAELLPNLKGYGNLPNLLYSMSLDPDLLESVQAFVLSLPQSNGAAIRADFKSLLFQWAAVSEVSENARGPYVDGREVALLEKFFGVTIEEASGGQNIGSRYASELHREYQTIIDVLLTRFLVQAAPSLVLNLDVSLDSATPFLMLSGLTYDVEADQLSGGINSVLDLLIAFAPKTGQDQLGYYSLVVTAISGLQYEYFGDDSLAFKSWLSDNLTAQDGDAALAKYVGLLVDRVSTAHGTVSNDTLNGTSSNDVVIGNLGADQLDGQGGSDTYVYTRGDGNDTIIEGTSAGTHDSLLLVDVTPSDITFVRNGIDVTLVIAESAPGAGDGGSVLLKDQLDDYFWRGIEQIVFAEGTIWTASDLRANMLVAAQTSGNDTITGFSTNDTFYWERGNGNDTIIESTNSGSADKLVLQGINPSDITFVRNGIDVTLVIAESAPGAGDGGSVLLKDQLDDYFSRGIEQIVFANGTIWTASDLRVNMLVAAQTSGNDTITGFSSNDTFHWARGNGNDTIIESTNSGNADKLVLQGINPSDVSFVRNGIDVTLVIAESAPGAGDGGSVLLKDQLEEYFSRGVEEIFFADGTIWTVSDLRANMLVAAQTSGNDTITGFSTNDTFYWARGNGNDTIIESTNSGSADKLVLQGINPSDVSFVRNGIDVTLVIAESAPGAGDGGSVLLKDQLVDYFSRGIEQIVFANGTIWTAADLLTLSANSPFGGTAGNDTISGTTGNDTFICGLGNDTISSGAGSDTHIYASGDGNDLIDEESGSTTEVDILSLVGLNPSDVVISRSGVHLLVDILSTGHRITVDEQFLSTSSYWGIEQIQFANGTVWDRAYLAANVAIHGTSGDDTLSGTSGNDTFLAGLGNDRINSGAGSDKHIYASGDGNDLIDEESGSTSEVDVLKLVGLNPTDVSLTRSGVHLLIDVLPTGHRITIDEQFYSTISYWGIEQVQFANGTVWDRAYLAANAAIRGTSGNDTLSGTSGNDTFIAGLGDDRTNSGGGSDTHIYASGDGNDLIDEESGSTSEVDVLKLVNLNPADVQLTRSGDHLLIDVLPTGHRITIDEQFYSTISYWGIEQVQFANGAVWDRAYLAANAAIRGTSGNDTLTGTSGNDLIDGGAGDDTLNGGAGSDTLIGGIGNDTLTGSSGSDTIIFAPGFGNDTISDFSAGSGLADVIELSFGSSFDTLADILGVTQQVGANAVIAFDASTSLTLQNVQMSSLVADDFRFV